MPAQDRTHNTHTAHVVKVPGYRLRSCAHWLLAQSHQAEQPTASNAAIKIVVVSDTRNHQPAIPEGDILIHAGNLSQSGSFREIQTQLSWLASQPHLHKVVIAGNYDILFDQRFLDSHREQFPVSPKETRESLNWGDIIYLENSGTTLTFPFHEDRKLKIYGSPLTPKSLDSAFQYPRDHDAWEGQDRSDIDILVTHGPAWGHLDGNLRHGCQFLAHAISHWRPRLHVFGHIHAGYGREVVRYDAARRNFEDVQRGWAGWEAVAGMATSVAWSNVRHSLLNRRDQLTEHVNASVVDDSNRLVNEAMVAYL